MLERLKRALVESYVGAIAVGWVFGQGILHFAYIFSAPFASWFTRRQYRALSASGDLSTSLSFADAVPELVQSLALLVFGYLLLRWLYYNNPLLAPTAESKPEESGASGS